MCLYFETLQLPQSKQALIIEQPHPTLSQVHASLILHDQHSPELSLLKELRLILVV